MKSLSLILILIALVVSPALEQGLHLERLPQA